MSKRKCASIIGGVVAAAMGLAWIPASAGDLDPPEGPVGPTFKPLSDLGARIAINAANTPGDAHAMFRISRAGSYYLTGNVQGVPGKGGIEIASDNVVIDLMGFSLEGGEGTLDGIRTTSSRFRSIAVRNGEVRDWGGDGIFLGENNFGSGGTVEGIRATGNAGTGIVAGPGSRIRACTAKRNGASGLAAGDRSVIEGCTAHGNTEAGVAAFDACVVRECLASLNGFAGLHVSVRCVVAGCAAHENGDCGVVAFGDTRITDSIFYSNAAHGILVVEGCLIRNNICSRNGLGGDSEAGVFALDNNRIEDNLLRHNSHGMFIGERNNLILGNGAAGNQTNYFVNLGNAQGVVLDLTSNSGQPVEGNSAADTIGSADAWANFAY